MFQLPKNLCKSYALNLLIPLHSAVRKVSYTALSEKPVTGFWLLAVVVVSDACSTARVVNTVKQPFTRFRPATHAAVLRQPSRRCPLTAVLASIPSLHLSVLSHQFRNLLASLVSSHQFRNLLASLVSSHLFRNLLGSRVFFSHLVRNLLGSRVFFSHLFRNLLGSRVFVLDLSRLFTIHAAPPSRICFRHYSLFSCPEVTLWCPSSCTHVAQSNVPALCTKSSQNCRVNKTAFLTPAPEF